MGNRKSSAHVGSVTSGAFVHNDRLIDLSYLIASSDNNEVDISATEAYQKYIKLKSEAIQSYLLRVGQKPQKNTEYLKEIIINLEEHHTLKDLLPISDFLEKDGIDVSIKSKDKPIYNIKTKKKTWSYKYETKNVKVKILQKSIHRDEGFIEEEGLSGKKERHYNIHAHIDFFAIDPETGLSIKFKSRDYERLQDITAKALNMERGKRKSAGEGKTKRLDTFEYKKHIEREAETVKQAENRVLFEVSEALGLGTPTLKEMKAHISKLRSDLVTANKLTPGEDEMLFKKEDYKAVSKLKNALKASNVKYLYEEYKTLKLGFESRISEAKKRAEKAEAKATAAEAELAKLKEENERANREIDRRDRRDESRTEDRTRSYTELTKSLIQSTDSLEQFSEGHHQAIEQATEDKQATAGALKLAESVAESVVRPILEIGRDVEKVISKKKIDFLKEQAILGEHYYEDELYELNSSSQERKTEVNELKSNLAILEISNTKKDAKIADLVSATEELELKEPSLKDALEVVAKHSGISADAVYDAVDHKIKELKKPDFIVDNDYLIGYEYCSLAMLRGEKWGEKSPIIDANKHQNSVLGCAFNKITEKLEALINTIDRVISESWKNYKKTSENKNIASKKPTNTKARTRLKRP